jgi:flagellar motility protein MotE (MotC chaperone)
MSDKSPTIKEILKDIDMRIAHIEDIVADNRDIIIKLVKQGNQVVNFLKEVEHDVMDDIEDVSDLIPSFGNQTIKYNVSSKQADIQKLVDDIIEKNEKLKEFEKELKKHKDDITPGTVGES